jgi:hypothetical protein
VPLDVDFNGAAVTKVFTSPSALTGATSYSINSATYPTLPASLTNYTVDLTATFNEGSSFVSGTDSTNIPGGGTINLNSSQNSASPEPASALPLGSGLAALFAKHALRRYRRDCAVHSAPK